MSHKWRSYNIWFLKYKVQWTEIFVISNHFLPFYPSNNQKNQNFEKMKILPGHLIILRMCTTNDNHMMYGSWDMEHDGQDFLSFWTMFCLLAPPKQMSFLTIYNKNIFFKNQGTRLGAIITPNKGVEQALIDMPLLATLC